MIVGCDRCAAREPSADPRDALIREQAQLIAAQADKIAALEAVVADLREQLEAAERGVAEQRELPDAAVVGGVPRPISRKVTPQREHTGSGM